LHLVRRAASIALRCQPTASGCGLDSKNTFSAPCIAVTSDPSSERSPVTVSTPADGLLAGSPARTRARTCSPRSSNSPISAAPILLRPPMTSINAVPLSQLALPGPNVWQRPELIKPESLIGPIRIPY
jgi:hypothetical protein